MSDMTVVTEQVTDLYETVGWTMVGDVTFDAQTSEDLRPSSAAYVSACRLRVLRHLPPSGERILDMASGPIQYPEYLAYSKNFTKRVCVDLSKRALDMARDRIGDHGEYHVGDFLEMTVAPVDAAVSLHTIYHIDKERQEGAVRKLVETTKPGGVVVIVYSNPNYIVSRILAPLRNIFRPLSRGDAGATPDTIYFHRRPLSWWKRFSDVAQVDIYPWRTFSTREQLALFPSNGLGRRMLSALYGLEDRFPKFFTAIGCYPMIVLRRREDVR